MKMRFILVLCLVAVGPLYAVVQDPIPGHQFVPLGFDMDDDFIYGEAGEDDLVCDDVTGFGIQAEDVDGNDGGLFEDQIYVNCSSGSDVATCGGPQDPCLTINYAINTRAAGQPVNSSEEIICFTGTCTNEPDTGMLLISGTAGFKTRPKSGSEAADVLLPSNPFMIVGWDFDNDNSYPPFDTDDISVIDGEGTGDLVWDGTGGPDYIEMIHFSVEGYGEEGNVGGAAKSGFYQGQGPFYHYQHQLDLEILWGAAFCSTCKGWNNKNVNHRTIEDVRYEGGGYITRGGATIMGGLGLVYKRVTFIARPCSIGVDVGCDSGEAEVRIQDSWDWLGSQTHPTQWIDSVFDANFGAYNSNSGTNFGAIGFAQCSQWAYVRNNHVIDWPTFVSMESGGGFCEETPRPTDYIFIEKNLIEHTADHNIGNFMAIAKIASDNTTADNSCGGHVQITNNMVRVSGENIGYGVWIICGNDNGDAFELDQEIVIANNTLETATWNDPLRQSFILIENKDGDSESPYPDVAQNFTIKNNVVSSPTTTAFNIRILDYVPSGLVLEKNVWDPDMDYFLEGDSIRESLALWQTDLGGCPNAGNDCDSQECAPLFVSSTDLSLQSGDTCAKENAETLSSFFTQDIFSQDRTEPWDAGAHEVSLAGPLPATSVDVGVSFVGVSKDG